MANKSKRDHQDAQFDQFARSQMEDGKEKVDEEIKYQDREPDQQNRLKDQENRRI